MTREWDEASLNKLAADTQNIYKRNAEKWAAQRPQKLVELPWLTCFLSLQPKSPSILDLGSGAGRPIAAHLIEQGCRVTGIDASRSMIDMAKQNLPQGDWHVADMRTFESDQQFDGIIGWNSFFHLTQSDQIELLPKLAGQLSPTGALLLTVGPAAGEAVGQVGDDPIYHASLSPKEYEQHLSACGMSIIHFVPEDPDCYDMTILLAQRSSKQKMPG